MGIGIKMVSAVDEMLRPYTLESLQAMEDSNLAIPQLLCDGDRCLAKVQFVPRSWCYVSQERSHTTPAYIGLTADSRHRPGCEYNLIHRLRLLREQEAKLKRLAKRSAITLNLDGLEAHLGGIAWSSSDRGGGDTQGALVTTNVHDEYISGTDELQQYLLAIGKVLQLQSCCEHEDALAEHVALKFANRDIHWRDFFFQAERYEDAWTMARCGYVDCHPFAVMGTVSGSERPSGGAGRGLSYLNLHTQCSRKSRSQIRHTFDVTIGHHDAAWFDEFPIGAIVIAFGVWSAMPPKELPKARDILTHRSHGLVLHPAFKTQLLRLE